MITYIEYWGRGILLKDSLVYRTAIERFENNRWENELRSREYIYNISVIQVVSYMKVAWHESQTVCNKERKEAKPAVIIAYKYVYSPPAPPPHGFIPLL